MPSISIRSDFLKTKRNISALSKPNSSSPIENWSLFESRGADKSMFVEVFIRNIDITSILNPLELTLINSTN